MYVLLYRTNWLRLNGVLFKKPCALLLRIEEEQPVFTKVLDVYVFGQRPIAYTQLYKTDSFIRHYHVYTLSLSPLYEVVSLDSVSITYHVKQLELEGTISSVIIPKHYICQSIRT